MKSVHLKMAVYWLAGVNIVFTRDAPTLVCYVTDCQCELIRLAQDTYRGLETVPVNPERPQR